MLAFLLGAFLITLSGVMIPGPVSALTISQGAKSPHYGAFVAFGHGIVEVPIMILILFGFGELFKITMVNTIIGLLGGLFLLKLSFDLFKGINEPKKVSNKYSSNPLSAGIILTLLNPAYIAWMATVGSILILGSYKYGILGFVLYTIMHLLTDIIWLYFLSALSFKGGQFFGNKLQKILFFICGVSLAFFSIRFIYIALKNIF